jgi:hypothetical protein
VLKEMRKTGLAGRFVRGADFVPDHVRHDRSAMIRHHNDFEPVGQREVRNAGIGGRSRRRREPRQQAEHKQNSPGHVF